MYIKRARVDTLGRTGTAAVRLVPSVFFPPSSPLIFLSFFLTLFVLRESRVRQHAASRRPEASRAQNEKVADLLKHMLSLSLYLSLFSFA